MTHQPDGGPAMSEMPAKIWIDCDYIDSKSTMSVLPCNLGTADKARSLPNDTAYIRADIVEKLVAALRDQFCPRPCNGRPDQFDVGDCVDAMECGCGAGASLALYRKEISRD